MKDFSIKEFTATRPLSWSAVYSFEYDPEQWYQRYVLGIKDVASPEMEFGKMVGDRLAKDSNFMPMIDRLGKYEHELRCNISGYSCIGFMDSYDPKTKMRMDEFKTSRNPWTQKRADEHGQIDMYLLMHYLITSVRPESMSVRLWWLATRLNGDYTVSFVPGMKPLMLPTKRTLVQVLKFGTRLKRVAKEMEVYARTHS